MQPLRSSSPTAWGWAPSSLWAATTLSTTMSTGQLYFAILLDGRECSGLRQGAVLNLPDLCCALAGSIQGGHTVISVRGSLPAGHLGCHLCHLSKAQDQLPAGLGLCLLHPLLSVGTCRWGFFSLSLFQRLHYCLLYKLHHKHICRVCYFLYHWLHVTHHEEVGVRAGLLR